MFNEEIISYNLNGSVSKKIISVESISFLKKSLEQSLEDNSFSSEEIEDLKNDLEDILKEVSEEVFEMDLKDVLEKDKKFLEDFVEESVEYISKNY